MMDPEQAVRIMYAREIEENDDQTALINEKTVEYAQMQNSAESAAKRGRSMIIISRCDKKTFDHGI